MGIEKIAILLEIVGIGFESVVAVIFGQHKIRKLLQRIASFGFSIGTKILKGLPATDEKRNFYIGISTEIFLDFLVIFGLLKSITWLFGVGISGIVLLFILVIAQALKDKEKRSTLIPKCLPQWLIPLYMFLVFIPVAFIVAPMLYIPPIVIGVTFGTMSYILNFLASRDFIRWVFLSLGIAMIWAGLILEFVSAA